MLDHLEDETLAQKAQGGNEDAARELIRRYADFKPRLTEAIARSFRMPGLEYEEKVAECRLALAKAIRTYEQGKGTKFRTYAKTLMTNALIDMHRSANTKSALPPGKRLSLDVSVSHDDPDTPLVDMIQDDRALSSFNGADNRSDAEIAEVRLVDIIVESIKGGDAPVWMLRAIRCYADECLSQDVAADLVDLLRRNDDQPLLIELHPPRQSVEAEDLVREALSRYIDAQRMIMQDIADGYNANEIASRLAVPKRLVVLLQFVSDGRQQKAA